MKKLTTCFVVLISTLIVSATPAIAETDVIKKPQWVKIKTEGMFFAIDVAGMDIGTYVLNMGLQPAVEVDISDGNAGYSRVQVACHVTDPRFKARIGSYRQIRAGDFGTPRLNGDIPVSFMRTPGLMGNPTNSLQKAIARNVCALWKRNKK